jgi:RNA polymerase sigma-70 factor (ECF subfamily)
MFSKQEHCERVLALWAPVREKAYWAVLCIVNDRELAQDILQEALITAIEKFQTLRDESKFEPWFITISIRKAYETLSAKKTFTVAESLEDGPDSDDGIAAMPDNTFSAVQYRDLVLQILDWLHPESKKYLFYLKYIEDKSMEEIVRITGMKEGTLKSIYFRMRKELSLLLGKEYGADG